MNRSRPRLHVPTLRHGLAPVLHQHVVFVPHVEAPTTASIPGDAVTTA